MHRSLLALQVANLMAANPTIPLSGVAAGETFTIPCKPEQNCCPFYLYAAPNGTGKPPLKKSSHLGMNAFEPVNETQFWH